jgi:hypothetical protein
MVLMLTIRQAQLEAMGQAGMRRFEEILAHEVEARFPHAEPTVEALRARVRRGIIRAEAYGIESEADLAAFVFLMMEFGDGFDDRPDLPWAMNVLRNNDISGRAKMSAIAARRASLARRKERNANGSV